MNKSSFKIPQTKSYVGANHLSPPVINKKSKLYYLLVEESLIMCKSEASIYEYQNLLDVLAEMVTEYLADTSKGEESNE